jgi:hypothetical protein
MYLAKDAHAKFEEFYKEFFDEETGGVPKIKIYARRGAGFITKILNVNWITVGRRIFIRPHLTKFADDARLYAPKALIAHELAHVLQYQQLGFVKFFYTYLRDYFRILKTKKKWDFNARMEAYLEISHEIEARRFAAEFLEWLEKRQNKDKNQNL